MIHEKIIGNTSIYRWPVSSALKIYNYHFKSTVFEQLILKYELRLEE